MTNRTISRRAFGSAAAAACGFTIVPRHVLGGHRFSAPSDKLNIACIGVGGKGRVDSEGMAGENIVALCDVDDARAAESFARFPGARRYRDFRILLEKEKGIDAVTVTTPDHTHAVISLAAMQLGKHVFCQKPLAHSLDEARRMGEAARKHKVATQMGIQFHCTEGVRRIREWVEAGVIGTVREVHYWTNRPVWPQGILRPAETPPVPPSLDWDAWLGPAPERPYHPAYHPSRWRGWWDFGTGALGDMGCHGFDAAFWIFGLGSPSRIVPETTPLNPETGPLASRVTYEFPPRAGKPALKLVWRDGNLMPPRPAGLREGEPMPPASHSGQLLVGDKGCIAADIYAENPTILPETLHREVMASPPAKTYASSPGVYEEWIAACKGGAAASAAFDYSVPLTILVLLGNLAVRTGESIEWDRTRFEAANVSGPNSFIRRTYRRGW